MTGRTHDLAALAAGSFVFFYYLPDRISLGTLATAFGTLFIGGLYPDLDNASSDLWKKVPGGSLLGRLFAPLLGGHRMISHSLVGIFLTSFLLEWVLQLGNSFLLVDMNIIWVAFMTGYVSHILADSFTKEGIPLLFPIPIKFGIPPIKKLRLKTGGRMEKYIVYPFLLLITGSMYLQNYQRLLVFLQTSIY